MSDITFKKGNYQRWGGDRWEDKYIDIYHRNTKFEDYIHNCNHKVFKFEFSDGSIKYSPYVNRWSPLYKKMVFAKMYKLKRNLDDKSSGYKLGMLTLNSYEAFYYNDNKKMIGCKFDKNTEPFTDKEVLLRLKAGWNKLRQTINKMGYQYVLLYEPHKSGIPHMHIGIIGDKHLDIDQINKIKELWCNKYNMSTTDKDPYKNYKSDWDCIGFGYTKQEDEFFNKFTNKMEPSSLINYIVAYMSKSVMGNLDNPSFMRFNSLFWATRKRMWSTSALITKIMAPDKKDSNDDAPDLISIKVMEAKVSGLKDSEFCLLSDKKDMRESVIYDSDPREVNNVLKNLKKLNITEDIYELLLSKYNITHNKYVEGFYYTNEEELRTEDAREYANQHLNNKIKDKTTITPYIKPHWEGFKRITYDEAIDHYHSELKIKKRFSEDDLYL